MKIFHDGTIRIHQIDNDDLPLDITIRFDKKYKAGDHEVDVFVKEQGPGHGSFFKVDYDKADGPDCKPHHHPRGWW